MKLENFIEEFNGAPYDIFEFADVAETVEDDKALVEAAYNLLEARRKFIRALDRVDVEMG